MSKDIATKSKGGRSSKTRSSEQVTESSRKDSEVELPEEFPSHEEAFNYFKKFKSYNYEKLQATMDEHEERCRLAQKDYKNLVQVLQTLMEEYEKKREYFMAVNIQYQRISILSANMKIFHIYHSFDCN